MRKGRRRKKNGKYKKNSEEMESNESIFIQKKLIFGKIEQNI